MKKTISLLVFCLLTFTGCKQEQPQEPFLDVKKSDVSFPANGGEVVVGIETNITDLKVSVSQPSEWLNAKLEQNKLVLQADAQDMPLNRTCSVTLTGSGLTKQINVTQEAADVMLEVEPLELAFTADGGKQSITINANVEWTIEVPEDAQWIKATPAESSLEVEVEPFFVNELRSADLLIKSEGIEKVVKVSQQGEAPWLSIEIPTDFTKSSVVGVYYQNKLIAEVCREYIRVTSEPTRDTQEVVIYPVRDEKADLSKGIIVSDGSEISWNIEENTATITPLDAPEKVTILYYDGAEIQRSNAEGKELQTTNHQPIMLEDIRTGAKTETYPMVKIGTQYWMGENLRATNYLDGTSIVFKGLDEKWSTEEGAYTYPEGIADNVENFGLYYNGYAVENEKGLAPKGWKIPETTDFTKLNAYLGKSSGTKLKSPNFWQSDTTTDQTNITGFNATPAGHIAEGSTQNMIGIRLYLWTSNTSVDPLTRTKGMFYTMLNTGKVSLYTTFDSWSAYAQLHNLEAGHSVRCLRE